MMKENYSVEFFAEQKTESEGAQGSVRSKTGSIRSRMGSVRSEKSSSSRLNFVISLLKQAQTLICRLFYNQQRKQYNKVRLLFSCLQKMKINIRLQMTQIFNLNNSSCGVVAECYLQNYNFYQDLNGANSLMSIFFVIREIV